MDKKEVNIDELEKAIKEFKKFRETNEALRQRVMELANENDKLQGTRNVLRSEIERLKASQSHDSDCTIYIKELESRLWERDNEILKLKDELRKEKNNNSDEEIKKLKNVILAYKTENNLLKSKLERLDDPKLTMELYYETIRQILS